jgi:plastocyanin
MRRRYAVLFGLALAGAAAAPAQAEVVVTARDTLTWDQPAVSIKPGETVRWTFAGTAQAHNVTSGSDNWSLRSTLGVPAPDATYTFDTPGVYHFVCEVHRDTMVGDVTVSEGPPPPPPPPPPPSQQPFVNDAVLPVVIETGGLDHTRPGLAAVRAQRVSRGARVRFRVSEESQVTVTFKRAGRVVKRVQTAGSGSRTVLVRDAKLRAGRYQVGVQATDLAGNRSALRTVRVTLR